MRGLHDFRIGQVQRGLDTHGLVIFQIQDNLGLGVVDDAFSKPSLSHITVHGLRHMYATILIEQKVPLIKISALLGHASVNTTFEYYCEVMDENEQIITFMNHTFIPEGGVSIC